MFSQKQKILKKTIIQDKKSTSYNHKNKTNQKQYKMSHNPFYESTIFSILTIKKKIQKKLS